jgi:ring-1,2-phenylacetyl-CoA epoxidase subunit PaaD
MVRRALASRDELFQILDGVMDPEVPVLSVVELGIIRDAVDGDDGVVVTITPTYSGCPAMREIETEVRRALNDAGFGAVEIRTTYSPAWTTDWIGAAAKEKLEAYGIAPPQPVESTELVPLRRRLVLPRCP